MSWHMSDKELEQFQGGLKEPPVPRPDYFDQRESWFVRLRTWLSRSSESAESTSSLRKVDASTAGNVAADA